MNIEKHTSYDPELTLMERLKEISSMDLSPEEEHVLNLMAMFDDYIVNTLQSGEVADCLPRTARELGII